MTLYECEIRHARTVPLRNVFRYRSYLWLVDVDQLPRIPLLAVFRGRDHLGDPRRGIRENLDSFLAANGIGRPRTITMLTQARALGYVFNPLTVYWCHRPDCVVAEVHNTYGQRHAYLLHPDARGQARVPKQFYVSPFYPVDGDYRMSLPEPGADPGAGPGQRLALSVRLDRPDGHPPARPWPAPCSAWRWPGCGYGSACRTGRFTAPGDRTPRSWTCTGRASSSAGSATPA